VIEQLDGNVLLRQIELEIDVPADAGADDPIQAVEIVQQHVTAVMGGAQADFVLALRLVRAQLGEKFANRILQLTHAPNPSISPAAKTMVSKTDYLAMRCEPGCRRRAARTAACRGSRWLGIINPGARPRFERGKSEGKPCPSVCSR
jgi:hypothetical protein